MIKIISAIAKNGVIGQDNKLPFEYPADMRFFRQKTANSAIIMGAKTWESIGRPLPKRRNIVISRTKVDIDSVETFSSLSVAIESSATSHENVWLIGGTSIYRDGMEFANEMYLTMIPDTIKGNNLTFFPWISPEQFKVAEYITLEDSPLRVAKYVRI
jgi:dihydrofolate reductase